MPGKHEVIELAAQCRIDQAPTVPQEVHCRAALRFQIGLFPGRQDLPRPLVVLLPPPFIDRDGLVKLPSCMNRRALWISCSIWRSTGSPPLASSASQSGSSSSLIA